MLILACSSNSCILRPRGLIAGGFFIVKSFEFGIKKTYIHGSKDSPLALWVVLGWAYRGLTGGFLLLQNFSVAVL